jgi:hypothetical protein
MHSAVFPAWRGKRGASRARWRPSASAGVMVRGAPAADEQRASGDALQPRALRRKSDRQRRGEAIVVRLEERID